MHRRKFFDQFLAFARKSNVAPAPIRLGGCAGGEFPFHESIDNIYSGVVLYLEALAQLRNGHSARCVKSRDREQGFILLGIYASSCAQEIFAEPEKLAKQIPELGESLVVIGMELAHLAIK
jgi:hypothetical protein